MSPRYARWAALTALPLVLAAGCVDVSELQFVQDDRLTFDAPGSRELVETPLQLSWAMTDFEVVERGQGEPSDDAGYFAVFVDRAPVEPGETLEEVAGRDDVCRRDPACPDEQYLADRGVYVTTTPSLTIDLVPALGSTEEIELHDVTVILLDSRGRRIGESAWYREFRMVNRTAQR